MSKKIFIFTRYSVLLKTKAWSLSKDNDFIKYKEMLFDKDRMLQHFFLFENITVPSILKQKDFPRDIKLIYVVLTSSFLPEDEKIKLQNVVGAIENSDIIYLNPEENIYKVINNYIDNELNKGEMFASIRLDDDDALNPYFISSFSKYLNEDFLGNVITYAKGYAMLYDFGQNKAVSAVEINYPKNAQGLGFINAKCFDGRFFANHINVYEIGNHTKVDSVYPMIIDETIKGYIRMCYKKQDTAEKFYLKHAEKNKNTPFKKIFKDFEIDKLKI